MDDKNDKCESEITDFYRMFGFRIKGSPALRSRSSVLARDGISATFTKSGVAGPCNVWARFCATASLVPILILQLRLEGKVT